MYIMIGISMAIAISVIFEGILFVKEKTNAVIERFGKYSSIKKPGFNFKIPFIDKEKVVNLRIQQLDVEVESKTKDNVFVRIKVSVQHRILPDKVYDAVYKLDDAEEQMESYIFDVIRAKVPSIDIDDVFGKKDELAEAVKSSLEKTMDDFGYDIVNSLVTDIDPDEGVKAAMNKINETDRLKKAAENEGESEKIRAIKKAEGEARSKELQGEGIAKQRVAIAKGLKESVEAVAGAVEGVDSKEVMDTVMLTQYFDTLKDLGNASNTKVIMVPHGTGVVGDLTNAMISAKQSQ